MYWGIVCGTRSLAIQYKSLAKGAMHEWKLQPFHHQQKYQNIFPTELFTSSLSNYHSGQTINARLVADEKNKEPVMFSTSQAL